MQRAANAACLEPSAPKNPLVGKAHTLHIAKSEHQDMRVDVSRFETLLAKDLLHRLRSRNRLRIIGVLEITEPFNTDALAYYEPTPLLLPVQQSIP